MDSEARDPTAVLAILRTEVNLNIELATSTYRRKPVIPRESPRHDTTGENAAVAAVPPPRILTATATSKKSCYSTAATTPTNTSPTLTVMTLGHETEATASRNYFY